MIPTINLGEHPSSHIDTKKGFFPFDENFYNLFSWQLSNIPYSSVNYSDHIVLQGLPKGQTEEQCPRYCAFGPAPAMVPWGPLLAGV